MIKPEDRKPGENYRISNGQLVVAPRNRVSNKELVVRATRYMQACKETGYPDFAPSNGVCYRCKHNIFHTYTGSSPQITGCPYCSTSYCD